MVTLTFKPKQTTKKLLETLSDRTRDVLMRRHGLSDPKEQQTLESIGQTYGITRERVRQIENYGIQSIQKSDIYKTNTAVFDELQRIVDDLGSVITEEELLDILADDSETKNHIHFLLVLGEPFYRDKENSNFRHRWYTRKDIANAVEKALTSVYESLNEEDLVSEQEIIERLHAALRNIDDKYKDEQIAKRWLSLSKSIGSNPLGEWGIAASPNIHAKGIRDFAYLTVKRHGSPMHFREVAEAIEKLFGRKAHVATCHNELIKDDRFVLVGRGLYALTEWGYTAGVVKDVLRDILTQNGPLTREEIIDKVRKERYVKNNTIIVNLQDAAIFKRSSDGRYALVE